MLKWLFKKVKDKGSISLAPIEIRIVDIAKEHVTIEVSRSNYKQIATVGVADVFQVCRKVNFTLTED